MVVSPVSTNKAWPVFQRREEAETAIANGDARLIQRLDTYLTQLLPDDEYLKKHGDRAKRNYVLIAPLVEIVDPRIYDRRYRGRMVAKVAESTGRRKAQIYDVLRRYWQGGCVPNAILPDFHNSGNVKDRKDHGKKRGRPNNSGRNVTAEDREKFRLGVEDFKKTGITKTLPDTWKRTKEKYFNIGYRELRDGLLVPILPPANELPTLRQFKYEYYKTRDPKVEIVAADGEKAFECNTVPLWVMKHSRHSDPDRFIRSTPLSGIYTCAAT